MIRIDPWRPSASVEKSKKVWGPILTGAVINWPAWKATCCGFYKKQQLPN